jgi:hypothetical protein
VENNKPTIHQADLAKLPRALAPLIERPQWAIWRYTQLPNGNWQKPPFMATQPDRHVSTNDASTWTDYTTACAAVQAGHGDGISYILTENDPFAAIDIDNCRHVHTHSIDPWAQLFMQFAVTSYQEVTPSGEGVRIWGLANGATLNRKFTLEIDGKGIAVELFRRSRKALTITGYRLNTVRTLTDINKVFDWGVTWGERRKAAAAAANTTAVNGHHVNGNGRGYSIDEIEQIVRDGAPVGANRSDVFHSIVGHFVGCGWDVDRILAHMQEFPHGIGERYIHEDRLLREIARSAGKFKTAELPSSGAIWTNGNGWDAKAIPQPEADPRRDQDIDPDIDEALDEDIDPDLDDEDPDEDPDEDLDEDPQEAPKRRSDLPPLYAHGDPDARPLKREAIKGLMPVCGHGLMSGTWGSYKTFVCFDLSGALMTGQPFLGHAVKRQCGVLWIAAEGGEEIRLRLDALVREKCGGMTRAPFRWYETAPVLLEKGATDKLVAMGREAAASLQQEFGLPLGLIIIDTITACAGYSTQGAENDIGTGQAIMNILKEVAGALDCFALGVGHLGKDIERGTRGAGSKEDSGDLVFYCLGDKALSGAVTNARLAVRKYRGGVQGKEFPFTTRVVEHPEKDEDGEAITTLVIDWQPVPPGRAAQPQADPWAQGRKQEQRTAALRLKRVLMGILADQGVELPIPPDGPVVRMVAQKIVQKQFYMHTPADGTPDQKRKVRHQQFSRALAWAEDKQLIGVEEIDDITYLRLTRPDPENDDEGLEPE